MTRPYLFQYRGRQLKNFRTGFEKAWEAAGVSELIFHDTRRTAVRNMVLTGSPEKRAMQISGHRTRSVFDRYDITTEKDAMETGIHLQRHWERISEEEAQELAEQSAPLKLGEPAVRKDIQTGSVHSSKLLN